MVFTRYNKRANPRVQTSVTISPEFYNLCKEHNISISEATRVGISVMLAEKGVSEYDNRLNIFRQLQQAKNKASQYAQEAYEYKEKLEQYQKNIPETNKLQDTDL